MIPGSCLVEGSSVAPWGGKEQLSPLWKGLAAPLGEESLVAGLTPFLASPVRREGWGHTPTGQPLDSFL